MGTVQVRSLDQPDEPRAVPDGVVVGDELWVRVDASQAMADYAKPADPPGVLTTAGAPP